MQDFHRSLESDVECIVLTKEVLYEKGDPRNHGPHSTLECELLPSTEAAEGRMGRIYKLSDLQNLPPEIREQELESGVDMLAIPRAQIMGHEIIIPRGAAVHRKKWQNWRTDFGNRDNFFDTASYFQERRLAQTGDRTVLLVRVKTKGAVRSRTTASAAKLSDSVFGTDGDPVNLKSQYAACSYGKLRFAPFETSNPPLSAPGVYEVTVDTPESYKDSTEKDDFLVDEVTEQLNAAFGNTFPFDYVMICLPPDTFSGIGYAWKNGQRSVFRDNWCTFLRYESCLCVLLLFVGQRVVSFCSFSAYVLSFFFQSHALGPALAVLLLPMLPGKKFTDA